MTDIIVAVAGTVAVSVILAWLDYDSARRERETKEPRDAAQ